MATMLPIVFCMRRSPGSILVAALHTAVSIAQQNLYTLLSAQLSLVAAFHTLFAYVVAWLVVVVLLNVGW